MPTPSTQPRESSPTPSRASGRGLIPTSTTWAALWAALALCACDSGDGSASAATGTEEPVATQELDSADPAVQREIRDLITAVTPMSPTAPVGERNDWFGRRKETLERLREAGEEVGRAALAAYLEKEDAIVEVRVGLLDVASHNVPEETSAILVELLETFGPDLQLRSKAGTFLGLTSPEVAVEVLGPILLASRRTKTYPPEDQMLEAWNTAARTLELDRAPLLSDVAMNHLKTQDARHYAVRALGEFPSKIGRQALESLLVDSAGNNYVRRLAAQSLQKTVETGEFCDLMQRTGEREADPSFEIFLASMLEKHCR